jgi:hypothetical protein
MGGLRSGAMALGLTAFLTLGGLVNDGQAASPTIDGRFDGVDEGYTNGFAITMVPEGATEPIITGGEIWTHVAANGDVSVALIVPLSLKDNTYGTTGTVEYGKDQNKVQKFKELTGSDKISFQLNDAGGALVTNINLDFLHGLPDKEDGPDFVTGYTGFDDSPSSAPTNVNGAVSSMGYNFSQFGDPSGASSGTAGYPFEDPSDSPAIALNPDGSAVDYVPTNAAFSNWVFEHLYEFQVTAAAFGAGGFTSITQIVIDSIHLSPKKGDLPNSYDGIIGDPINGGSTAVIPEPEGMTLALMGFAGLLAAGWFSRKKRNVEATV